jgi:hypothetical protein
MDTLSFGLGIAFVVVVAIAIVAVLALFKSIKNQRQIENIWRDLSDSSSDFYGHIGNIGDSIHRRIDSEVTQIRSDIDSRLDKLENKLKNK